MISPYSYNGHWIDQAPDKFYRCTKCCGAIGFDLYGDDRCTEAFLDLSPLQKFMGRRIPLKNSTGRPVTIGDVTVAPNSEAMVWAEAYCRKYNISGPDSIVSARIMGGPDAEMRPNRMYGMDYDFDWVLPAPPPESGKSSLDEDARDQAVAEFQERIRLAEMTFGLLSPPPPPPPEKSPQEKAFEDFIAKRKAKREVVKPAGNVIGNGPGVPDPTYHKDMYHLDRAMRRLSFHEQDIHTRLMPYRREE